jgi:DnaJ-class molecular chaperone
MNEYIKEGSNKIILDDQGRLNYNKKQLRKLYLLLSAQFHPDKHPNSPEPDEYKSKFQEIGNAYTTLIKIAPKTT